MKLIDNTYKQADDIKTKTQIKKIMSRAWEIAREAAKKFNCKVSGIHFGLCLKMAWESGAELSEDFLKNEINRATTMCTRGLPGVKLLVNKTASDLGLDKMDLLCVARKLYTDFLKVRHKVDNNNFHLFINNQVELIVKKNR